MPHPVRSILVCTAGLLYGCMGFCLSVLAAAFNAVTPATPSSPHPEKPHHLRRPIHSRPRDRSASRSRQQDHLSPRHSIETALSSEPPQTPGRGSPALHIPLVESPTEISHSLGQENTGSPPHDYFTDSAVHMQRKSRAKIAFSPETRPRLLEAASAPAPVASSQGDDDTHHAQSADERVSSGFKLHFKRSWTERRRKASTPATLSPASPDLLLDRSSTLPSLVTPPSPLSPKVGVKSSKSLCPKKRSKTLRKAPSAPAGELPTLQKCSTSLSISKADKKRPPPLRTHPYEAPYFFPIPGSEAAMDYAPRARSPRQTLSASPPSTQKPLPSPTRRASHLTTSSSSAVKPQS
ncbi:hypothetical protein HGRIS_008383 [Hohenbuehelia grisea]|uniref:Transmembrane protein n=1 Tax=Hohenbuehelia grisea TaxID=104357 RepID=A0ABR3J7S8_9AGAR